MRVIFPLQFKASSPSPDGPFQPLQCLWSGAALLVGTAVLRYLTGDGSYGNELWQCEAPGADEPVSTPHLEPLLGWPKVLRA